MSDGRFLLEPGVINTISLLRPPPPRSPPPPAGLKNKQAQEAQGRGVAGAAWRQEGPAQQGRRGGQGDTHGHTGTATGAGARQIPVGRFLSLWPSLTLSFLICSMG